MTKEQGENMTFTKEQIEAGIKLAQAWYEGWKLQDLEPEQIIEAIEKADLAQAQATIPLTRPR